VRRVRTTARSARFARGRAKRAGEWGPRPALPDGGEGKIPSLAMGTIYVVATPIGNLEDITLRAIRVLREVDVVAAEDTRRARVLLDHLGIAKRVVAYYDAVEAARAPELVARALAGESIALVSDAGTPLVADPGFRLVRAAIAAGVSVVPVPGPSAVTALLSCAGLPPARFTFVGFLPARQSARRRALAELADRPDTLIFYEAPRRLPAALADMADVLGDRPAAIGRELTKRFEEIARGGVAELAQRFAERAGGADLRGEVVLAVAGRPERAGGARDAREEPGDVRAPDAPDALRPESLPDPGGDPGAWRDVDARLRRRLDAGEPLSSAARAVAGETGRARRDVYRRGLALRAPHGA